ncbi:hypothetical protein OYC64_003837 [Pagothenia borchgrevinki]|uniref:Uncharacterized protein n=1 Tax=Pagothenia borchgrevinki TaxID=8213 RepID=A0ABD2FRH2_PAGBO
MSEGELLIGLTFQPSIIREELLRGERWRMSNLPPGADILSLLPYFRGEGGSGFLGASLYPSALSRRKRCQHVAFGSRHATFSCVVSVVNNKCASVCECMCEQICVLQPPIVKRKGKRLKNTPSGM